jgi:hypothetical protein
MSPEQAKWLSSNKRYRAAHTVGGNTRFAQRGILHADGKYEPFVRGKPQRITQGCFEVGVLEVRDPASGQWEPARV